MGKFALRGLAHPWPGEAGRRRASHVGHVVIDGGIASSDAKTDAERAGDRDLDPDAIAQTFLHCTGSSAARGPAGRGASLDRNLRFPCPDNDPDNALPRWGRRLSAGLALRPEPAGAEEHQALDRDQGQLVQFAAQTPDSIDAAHCATRRRVDRGRLRAGPTRCRPARRSEPCASWMPCSGSACNSGRWRSHPLLSEQFHDPRATLEHYANLANAARLRGMQLLVRSRRRARPTGASSRGADYLRAASNATSASATRKRRASRWRCSRTSSHWFPIRSKTPQGSKLEPSRLAQRSAQDNHRSARAAGGLYARIWAWERACGQHRGGRYPRGYPRPRVHRVRADRLRLRMGCSSARRRAGPSGSARSTQESASDRRSVLWKASAQEVAALPQSGIDRARRRRLLGAARYPVPARARARGTHRASRR